MFTVNTHPLVKIPSGKFLRGNRGLGNGAHHHAGHNPHNAQHHQQQRNKANAQYEINVGNRVRRIPQIIHGKQPIIRVLRNGNTGSHNQCRVGLVPHRHILSLPVNTLIIPHRVPQRGRNCRGSQRAIATLFRHETTFRLAVERQQNPLTFIVAASIHQGQVAAHIAVNLAIAAGL